MITLRKRGSARRIRSRFSREVASWKTADCSYFWTLLYSYILGPTRNSRSELLKEFGRRAPLLLLQLTDLSAIVNPSTQSSRVSDDCSNGEHEAPQLSGRAVSHHPVYIPVACLPSVLPMLQHKCTHTVLRSRPTFCSNLLRSHRKISFQDDLFSRSVS